MRSTVRLKEDCGLSSNFRDNIALNGAFLVAQAGEAVQMKHLLQAAFRECKKEGRATTGTRNWVVPENARAGAIKLLKSQLSTN